MGTVRKVFHTIIRKMSTEPLNGAPMSEIYFHGGPFDFDHLPPVANKRDHIVLYKLPIDKSGSRTPEPYRGEMKWDSNHVRLPCSPHNGFSVEDPVQIKQKIQSKKFTMNEIFY